MSIGVHFSTKLKQFENRTQNHGLNIQVIASILLKRMSASEGLNYGQRECSLLILSLCRHPRCMVCSLWLCPCTTVLRSSNKRIVWRSDNSTKESFQSYGRQFVTLLDLIMDQRNIIYRSQTKNYLNRDRSTIKTSKKTHKILVLWLVGDVGQILDD